MDLTIIEANKINFIYQVLPDIGSSSFTAKINNVSFIPDYMIVHSINYIAVPADPTALVVLYCDLVGQEIGMIGIDLPNANKIQNPVGTPKVYFKINKPLQGTSTFIFRQFQEGETFEVNLAGQIGICLEFIKLKAEKPQKVY